MGLPAPPEVGANALPLGTYDGQIVIVTGGGTGLGKAIAVEFARVGASVAILSRGEEHRAAGLAAVKGWVIGGSFERALLADMRIAGESTKMMLPEIKHGVIPDSGGTARLFQMAGHGLVADLAMTGRAMEVEEAYRHGVVSRVVPDAELDDAAMALCREIAANPPFAVKMFRRTLSRLGNPDVQRTMQEESMGMTAIYETEDYAEMKAARAEGREPKYEGR